MKVQTARLVVAPVAVMILATVFRAAPPASFGVRGRVNATVSMVADDRFVAAVWSASTDAGVTDIYAAVSRDRGATFSAPVRVNSTAGAARVSGEQPPRAALVAAGRAEPDLAVVWTAPGKEGTALMTARSSDGGRRFTSAATVPGSSAAGNRGWAAIATDKSGRVDAVWLDHRETAAPGASGDMSHHADHQMSAHGQADSVGKAQLSKLYFGAVDGPAPGRALTGGVCYCCKTAFAVGADGSLYAAWRHVYPGNLRDIAFTMSRDGGKTFSPPVRVSEDRWALDGCPENGPAIAIDARNVAHVAWPTFVGTTGASGALGLFYAASADGAHFGPRQTISTSGTPRHVQIVAANDGSLALAWDEADAGTRRVAFARGSVDRNGPAQFRRQILSALGDASYPALVLTGGTPVVAASRCAGPESAIRFTQVRVE